MSGSRRWSDVELTAMREFIHAFPDEILRTNGMHPLLEGRFPGRSVEAIYHGWRRCKGYKRKRKPAPQLPIPQDMPSRQFVDSLAQFIKSHIDAEVNRRISELTAQNDSLRRKIREIVDL